MKIYNRMLKMTIALSLILSANIPAVASEKPWYENYVTEGGTRLTRDYSFGLTENFDATPQNGLKERFEFFKNELPDEVPLFAPFTKEEIAKSKIKIFVAPYGDDRNGD